MDDASDGEQHDWRNLDLLHPSPFGRLDLHELEAALDFAFASGGAESLLDDCLSRAEHAPTTWDPRCFERGVFLNDLVKRCFPIVIERVAIAPHTRHLARLLARPPADVEVVRFRQDVLRELTGHEPLRRDVERVYTNIRRFGELLGSVPRYDQTAMKQRRVEILAAAHDVIEALADGFDGATSGLARMRRFGRGLRATEAYRRLTAVLELDGHRAGLDVRLRVGHDGELRSFEIVRVADNTANPFYESPLRRLWRKAWSWFRGYGFKDDEVLERLVDAVFVELKPDLVKLFQLRGDLEVYLASLGMRDMARARGLDVCLPTFGDDRALTGLFNPHLLSERRAPVPCSLTGERSTSITVLTGPNSGGKTRLLEAIAITQMLGQAGVFVPAKSARLVWAEGLFASLVEASTSDQTEGRLGVELLRIRDVFEKLRPNGMVVLDELCSGTNPSEGEEIFELVTSLLAQLRPQAFVTTHLLDFAARLRDRDPEGAAFLQVQLDQSDEPTYQFVPGVAKSSLARKTAARLGVTREALQELVDRHESRTSSDAPARPRDRGETSEARPHTR